MFAFGQVPVGQVQVPIDQVQVPIDQAQVQPFRFINAMYENNDENEDKSIYTVNYDSITVSGSFDFSKYSITNDFVKIIIDSNKIKNLNLIPPHIKHIILSYSGTNINFYDLPDTIKILEIENSSYIKFNSRLDKLPANLQVLIINTKYNLPLDNLPDSLKVLKIESGFDHPVEKLPSNLKILNLGNDFNQEVNNLPNSIECLILGDSFDQPINNLPHNLKQLIVGKNFSQPLENLPKLTHLEFNSNEFNRYSCYGGSQSNKKLIQNLPESCTTLILKSKNFWIDFERSLTPNIKKLHIKYCKLPVKQKYRIIKIKSSTLFASDQMLNLIPNSVEELILDNPDLDYAYDSCSEYEEVDLQEDKPNDEPNRKKTKLENKIRIGLDELDEENSYVYLDLTILPNSIKKLTVSRVGCKCEFPKNITSLTLIDCCEYMNFRTFPNSIKYLELTYEENEYSGGSFLIKKLPEQLEYLVYSNIKISNLDRLQYYYPNVKFIEKRPYDD